MPFGVVSHSDSKMNGPITTRKVLKNSLKIHFISNHPVLGAVSITDCNTGPGNSRNYPVFGLLDVLRFLHAGWYRTPPFLTGTDMRTFVIAGAFLLSFSLSGCAVVSVAGTVVSTTVSVAGSVVSTTAEVVGAGVKTVVGANDKD